MFKPLWMPPTRSVTSLIATPAAASASARGKAKIVIAEGGSFCALAKKTNLNLYQRKPPYHPPELCWQTLQPEDEPVPPERMSEATVSVSEGLPNLLRK